MGIRSDAHFGVNAQLLESVVDAVRDALRDFDAARYGVSEIRVEIQDDDSFVITLALASDDAERADADAEEAVEAINEILRKRFERGALRERQRELTLA